MADVNENIKTLMEVTGLDIENAKRVFEFKDSNLDQAINYILDGNEVPDDVMINNTDIAGGASTSSTYKDPGFKNMPKLVINANLKFV